MARSFSSTESRLTNKEHCLVQKGNGFPRRLRKVSLIAQGTLECKELVMPPEECTFTKA